MDKLELTAQAYEALEKMRKWEKLYRALRLRLNKEDAQKALLYVIEISGE